MSSKPERTVTRSEHGDRSLTISKGYAKDTKIYCLSNLDCEDGGCIPVLPHKNGLVNAFEVLCS